MAAPTHTSLEAVLEFACAENRVCPQPQRGNELWEMLPKRKHIGADWSPSLTLILAAWWETSCRCFIGSVSGLPVCASQTRAVGYAAGHDLFTIRVDVSSARSAACWFAHPKLARCYPTTRSRSVYRRG